MVVRKSNYKDEHGIKEEGSTKEKIMEELQKQSDGVLALAYLYARGYQLGGIDITKEWTNAVMNNQVIEDIYRRGYEDALNDIKEKKRRDFYHKVIRDLKVKGENE